ncbi:MAG: MBL fold metallo-hydrolase [Verrucomicrobiota bacterium]|jgi:glyoxylase-like metal-dependent hydrolase (beta-lactamase superfamily II)
MFDAFHKLKLRHWHGQCNPKLAANNETRQRFGVNLEDHLGDILRKARMMSNVSTIAAANAAGISETEFYALEESGHTSKKINFSTLAPLLGLNAAKLEGIARGWLPSSKDLSVWRELHQISTIEGGNEVHCYLVWDEVTRDAALFDTGWNAEPIFKLVGENQLQLKHLFITHTHHDHVAAMQPIRERFPKIHLHTDAKGAPPQHRNRRNDFIMLGSLRITNRETPGHAKDGVTYIIGTWGDDAPHVAIVGDAIFAGSIGGAPQHGALAKQKVREQILSLPPETLICPGHGPLTTVAEEKEHNPFF